MSLLTLTDIMAVRGGRTLFRGLDLTLTPGGAAIVTGPNGAGKTTLLRIAAGLGEADSGSVVRAGQAAWLGEGAALDGERTLADALHFWAIADGEAATDDRVARGMAAFGLGELAKVPVRLLSTGQRRRAALARVVASAVALWLLDEPANGLDTAAVAALERALAAHRAAGGAALVTTHQPLALPGAQTVTVG